MNKKIFLAMGGCIAMMFSACSKDDPQTDTGKTDDDENPVIEEKISITPAQHKFAVEGGTFEVTVSSSSDWTVTPASESWITPNVTSGKNGGKVIFTAAKNKETTSKSAVFTFTAGKKTAKFSATQAAVEAPKKVIFELQNPADANLTLGANTKDCIIFLKTSLENENQMTHSLNPEATWITSVRVIKGADLQVAIQAEANTTPDPRTAVLTLATEGANDIVINITQEGKAQAGGDIEGYENWIGTWEWKGEDIAEPITLIFAEKEKGINYNVSFDAKYNMPSFTVQFNAENKGITFIKCQNCGKYNDPEWGYRDAHFVPRYFWNNAEMTVDSNFDNEEHMNIADVAMTVGSTSEASTTKIYLDTYGEWTYKDMGFSYPEDPLDWWTDKSPEPRLLLPGTMTKK